MARLAAQAEHGHGLHQFARLGAQAAGCGGAFFRSEAARMAQVVKNANVKLD